MCARACDLSCRSLCRLLNGCCLAQVLAIFAFEIPPALSMLTHLLRLSDYLAPDAAIALGHRVCRTRYHRLGA